MQACVVLFEWRSSEKCCYTVMQSVVNLQHMRFARMESSLDWKPAGGNGGMNESERRFTRLACQEESFYSSGEPSSQTAVVTSLVTDFAALRSCEAVSASGRSTSTELSGRAVEIRLLLRLSIRLPARLSADPPKTEA